MGDVLRDEVSSGSGLASVIRESISKGQLVDASVCSHLLRVPFGKALSGGGGYILDGYPRSVAQVHSFFEETAPEHLPEKVVEITMDREVALAKLLGRRQCASCGQSFNVTDIRRDGFDMPPILPSDEVCPRRRLTSECTSDFIKRNDDTEETIRERFKVYDEETKPVLAFFKERGMLSTFMVKKGIADSQKLFTLLQEASLN